MLRGERTAAAGSTCRRGQPGEPGPTAGDRGPFGPHHRAPNALP
jgi:hypothetical protein